MTLDVEERCNSTAQSGSASLQGADMWRGNKAAADSLEEAYAESRAESRMTEGR